MLLVVQRNLTFQGKWMLVAKWFYQMVFFFPLNRNNSQSIGTGNHRGFPLEIPPTTQVPTAHSIESISGMATSCFPWNSHLGPKPAPEGQPRVPCLGHRVRPKRQTYINWPCGERRVPVQGHHLPPHLSQGCSGMAWCPLSCTVQRPKIWVRAVGKGKNWVSLLYFTWSFS